MSRRLISLMLLAGQAFGVAPASDPEALLAEAKTARKEKRYKTAITLLEQCLVLAPDNPDCTVSMASVYASRGSDEANEEDNKKAKYFYERFLNVCRPDDQRITRVREVLGIDPSAPAIVVSQPPPRPKLSPAPTPTPMSEPKQMAGERVVITVGGTHRISVPSFERVNIAQKAIATVELESPGVLLVTGRKAGNTMLTWSTADHQTWAIPVTVQAK